MTKLKAYDTALTLYGRIFSQLNGREERYFLGTIKRDFVFFLFALIWKGAGGASSLKSKSRLIPRNFNEWSFGKNYIVLVANSPRIEQNQYIWNTDREYFQKNSPPQRNSNGIAVLGCGIDFEKNFDLASLSAERDIRTVAKKSFIINIKSLPFFLQNFAALFSIYRVLKKNCALHCSLPAFLRYFIYYAFASARIRATINNLAKDSNIGKVMSSDLDNVIGNSFILWSQFYGLSQIAYPHGSPLFLNKNRYFEPEEYYIWTKYQKEYAEQLSSAETKFIYHPPKWLNKPASATSAPQNKDGLVKNILIVTAMEENLEVPFGNQKKLLEYIETIAQFAAKKNIAVYIKSHKLLDWHNDYDRLCQKYDNLTHVHKRWGIEEIKNNYIGILMNTSTTMALQLLYCGVPVITCAEVMSTIVPKHFLAPYLQFIAKTQGDLSTIIKELLEDKEKYKLAQTQAVQTFEASKL